MIKIFKKTRYFFISYAYGIDKECSGVGNCFFIKNYYPHFWEITDFIRKSYHSKASVTITNIIELNKKDYKSLSEADIRDYLDLDYLDSSK